MNPKAFLDTNVLIYAVAGRQSDPLEYAAARAIIRDEFAVSPLILGEFLSVVRRPQKELMTLADANRWVEKWKPFCTVDIDTDIINAASVIRERYKIQYWDAAHIACAERLNIRVLYTEDLNDSQTYGSVTVVNPFRAN
jgi:predicted nucleic acid-binding protein